jgi:hypothetical protein
MALEREIARDLGTIGAAIVLRVGGVCRFTLELRMPDGRLDGATASFGVIRSLLAAVPRLRIVYSCGVGDQDAAELPRLLLQLRRDVLRDRCEARLHDYFAVSPSYCLLGRGGRYRGAVHAERRTLHIRAGHARGMRSHWRTGSAAGAHILRPATRSRRSPQAAPRSSARPTRRCRTVCRCVNQCRSALPQRVARPSPGSVRWVFWETSTNKRARA